MAARARGALDWFHGLIFRESQSDCGNTNRRTWISSMRISDEPVWTAMIGLVAMKPSLSSRAPVSPNRYGHVQTRSRLVSLVGQSFTMPLELSLWHKVRENLHQKW